MNQLAMRPTISPAPIASAVAALPAALAATSAVAPREPGQAPTPAEKPSDAPRRSAAEATWCSGLHGAAAANDGSPGNTEDSTLAADDDALDGIKLGRRLARSTVSKRMVAAREIAGLSQTEAAVLVGYAKSGQLSLIEAGAKELPLWALVSAARAYGVSCDFILGCSDEHERDPALALRSGLIRATRTQVDRLVEAVAGSFDSHAVVQRLADVYSLTHAVGEMLDALSTVERAKGFDELRGGAKLVWLADRVRDLHVEMVHKIREHEQRDVQLRRQLAAARNAAYADAAPNAEPND